MLDPLEVVNPFADKIKLPEDAHKIRRLNELYQSFVRQITFAQSVPSGSAIIAAGGHRSGGLAEACEILFESIVLKVDELDGSLRQFFETIKKHVEKLGRIMHLIALSCGKLRGLVKRSSTDIYPNWSSWNTFGRMVLRTGATTIKSRIGTTKVRCVGASK